MDFLAVLMIDTAKSMDCVRNLLSDIFWLQDPAK